MSRGKTTNPKWPIESYEHKDKKHINNPPVSLVPPETDPEAAKDIDEIHWPGLILLTAQIGGSNLHYHPASAALKKG